MSEFPYHIFNSKNYSNSSTWMLDNARCKKCDSNIVVCQSKEFDYFYYCSQKGCKNHKGEEKYDTDELPNFIKRIL